MKSDLYPDYNISGPSEKKGGRLFVGLYNPITKHKTSMSYPRLLMENHLGRKLVNGEEVHHKDENFLNNNLDNLEIVDELQHKRAHGRARSNGQIAKMIQLECPGCGEKFERRESWIKSSIRNYGTNQFFCSQGCRSSYNNTIR